MAVLVRPPGCRVEDAFLEREDLRGGVALRAGLGVDERGDRTLVQVPIGQSFQLGDGQRACRG